MTALLELDDGTHVESERDPVSGWYLVKGRRPRLGSPVTLDGARREVAVVAELPENTCGLHLIPDFMDAGCEACGRLPERPTPEWCRVACGGRHRPYRFWIRGGQPER